MITMNQEESSLEQSAIKEHEYCLRCGRRLKNLDARIKGYGPICYMKMRVEHSKRTLFTTK